MARLDRETVLKAMRADSIPADRSGRWSIVKDEITPAQSETMRRLEKKGKCGWVPPGSYTWLFCATMDSVWKDQPGETVMNDFPCELSKHLEFIVKARGRVLVGGLGLGCVVRGLLAHGQVEHIDVVEREQAVIDLCGPSVADPRVTIQKRSAENAKGGPWDWIWWDLWNDPERSEPHLQLIHVDLVGKFMNRCRNLQGCWAMPRKNRRSMRGAGVML